MRMENRLASITTSVDANIETSHLFILLHNVRALLLEHTMDSVEFRLIELEIIGDVPLGNNERMQRSDRKSVADGEAKARSPRRRDRG
jgi:hypothetical protein